MTAVAYRHFETETGDRNILRGTVQTSAGGDGRVEAALLARHDDGTLYRSMRFDAYQATQELADGTSRTNTYVWLLGAFDSNLFEFDTIERLTGCELLNLALAAADSTSFQPYITAMFEGH